MSPSELLGTTRIVEESQTQGHRDVLLNAIWLQFLVLTLKNITVQEKVRKALGPEAHLEFRQDFRRNGLFTILWINRAIFTFLTRRLTHFSKE